MDGLPESDVVLQEQVEAVSEAQPGDLDLAVLAQHGDVRAFAALLRRHDAVLRRTILRRTGRTGRTGRASDVDDVLQEAALKAWQHLPSLREPAKARAWILQIAAREALRSATAHRQEHELTEDAAFMPGPDLHVDRFDVQDGLRAALRAMPQQQARSWVLREVDGLSYRDIAQRLVVPESSVRGSLALARQRIQRAIDDCCPTARPQPSRVPDPAEDAAPASASALEVTAAKEEVATLPPAPAPRGRSAAALVSPLHEDFDLDAEPRRPQFGVPDEKVLEGAAPSA